MPFGGVTLVPGVNVERTPTTNKTGVSQSQLIRYRDSLIQKLGGWSRFYPNALPGIPRDLHAWEDLNGTNHLGYGSSTQLGVITSTVYADVTPQTLTSNVKPFVQATANSTTITITDYNISNVTTYDSILFNTPMSCGGSVLSGLYPIISILGTQSYTINAATAAATTNTIVTNATSAIGSTTLNFTSVPSWVQTGMLVVDLTGTTAIGTGTVVSSKSATTIVISTGLVSTTNSGDSIVVTSIPRFSATSGSANVGVELISNGLGTGNSIVFPIPTTNASAGITINGSYPAISVTSASSFLIAASMQAATTVIFDMNGGAAEIVYYINIGPPATGAGYGLGGYGLGGYGSGAAADTSQSGSEITASDWTLDNWGQLLIATPANGGVYTYDPTGGFANAGLVNSAPFFNGGIFVSTSQQILVCWATTQARSIGIQQDPMLVKWSDVSDFTTFTPLTTNQAGSFRIPIGSKIMGGCATPNQNLIWTDLDLWAMNYQGQPFVFGFNKIGAGAGLISAHAVEQLRGGVYWMGQQNFYAFDNQGVRVLPCSVWDFVFQNINSSFVSKVRAIPNTPFNEIGWAFPSLASSGENDSYVKFNITEPNTPWDYGTLSRSAAIDQTIFGTPIQATPTGIIYQHEISDDADGSPLVSSFLTGYFYISEGEEFAFVDRIIPDFKYGTFGAGTGAQIQITIYAVNFPGDTPTLYGPYTVTSTTQYISTRIRARQMAFFVESSDIGSFWRLGHIRFRYSPDGRR